VLAVVGRGVWPSLDDADRDAHLWVKFTVRAHHMQAQTLARRFEEASVLWSRVDGFVAEHRLPDRLGDPLFDAMLGPRVRRTGYVKRSGVEAARRQATWPASGCLRPRAPPPRRLQQDQEL